MRVALCVDALAPQPGGIGRYTWELSKGLAESREIDSLHYFGRGRLIAEPRLLIEGISLPRRRRMLRPFHDWQLRHVLQSSVVHGPNYFLPGSVEGGVITVHDLSVFRFPETHPLDRVRAFERLFESSMKRSAHIITDTETIRRELVETFSVRPESVTAIPLAVNASFRPVSAGSISRYLGEWGLTAQGYGLCISTLEPRKKILELIRAWRRLPDGLKSAFPLVLAGGSGWENEHLHDEIEIAVAEGWLRHLGFVDEHALPALYAGAALFVYPSSYEGFGLPPLEAMASGVPVIAANRTCLPEVCGDAARYVDPDDEDSLTDSIRESLLDADWRTEAARRGLQRASQFTWRRCVAETLTVYRKVVNRR